MQAPTAAAKRIADTVFAVHVTCADGGVEHLVRDDLAAAAIVTGGKAEALCGHQVTLGSALTMPTRTCDTCPQIAIVLDLTCP